MRLVLLLSFVIVCQINVVAQSNPPAISWQKCFGGGSHETVDGTNIQTQTGYARNFALLPSGEFYIAGLTKSNNGDISGNHGGGGDIWIAKIDTDRTIIWSRTLGGSNDDIVYSIQADYDGGVIIGGTTNSQDGDISGLHGTDFDVWVIKLDKNGNVVWKKCFGGTKTDYGCKILVVDNGYIFISTTQSTDGDVLGNHGMDDVWIVQLDRSGNIIWQKCVGGSGGDLDLAITPTSDSGYLLSIYSSSNDGDTKDVPYSLNSAYPWVVKLNSLGQIQWQKRYPDIPYGYILQIKETIDGGFLMAGASSSTGNIREYDAVALKIDRTGNQEWVKSFGGSKADGFTDIVVQPDNSYILSGYTESSDRDIHENKGVHDAWVVHLNVSGQLIWEKTYGGSYSDLAYGIYPSLDGTLIVFGTTASYDHDVNGNHGGYDLWLFKIGAINTITGRVFYDGNNNGIIDAGEKAFNDARINSEKSGTIYSAIPSNGKYTIFVDSGKYVTKAIPLGKYQQIVPLSANSTFPSYFNTDTIDFAVQAEPGHHDLAISILADGPARTGFAVYYKIIYKNVGTEPVSGFVKMIKDSRLNYLSAFPNPTTQTADSMTWSFSNLLPGDSAIIQPRLAIPGAVGIGSILNHNVNVISAIADEFLENNSAFISQNVVGSYDPNDKSETHARIISPQQISKGDYLNYLIRFQNVGNDTAFNIVLRDTLDANLDWNSLQMIASSHLYGLQIKDGNKLSWIFENILLPDSNVNEPASHGYVSFKIKPKSTLVLGNSIRNSASIYFDFNLPVRTNTEITEVKLPRPPDPYVTGLKNNYCSADGVQKIKINNLPALGSGITVTVNVDGNKVALNNDSTFSFNVGILSAGTHNLSVLFSNSSDNRNSSSEFTVATSVTPDVNIQSNITNITNLTTPVIITGTNAAGGGAAPLYTFAKDRNFTIIAQAESVVNFWSFNPSILAIGDNMIYIRMKSNAGCVVTNMATDSILLKRSSVTGITDPDMPGQTINIYPNPFKDQIMIKELSASKTYTVILYNLEGRQLMNRRVSNRSTLNILRQHQAAGTYWLSIYDEKHKQLLGTVKLMKQ